MAITILRAGPGVTVQDMGRPGWLAQGLSAGGAMDRLALFEGAALLGQSSDLAALEIGASFVRLLTDAPLRIALIGAPMRATCDGAALVWNASHAIAAGSIIEVTALVGGYGYLCIGGGIDTPVVLGSRSAHLAAGIGRSVLANDILLIYPDTGERSGLKLALTDRCTATTLRFTRGPQTALFDADTLARFQTTQFIKDTRGNRMGQRLTGGLFASADGLSILSEAVLPGDIQITGDGTPFVLLAESQTTGGYPRIGRILPCDIPAFVQLPIGSKFTLQYVDINIAQEIETSEARRRLTLASALSPLIRDPATIPDLLGYQLISGVTRGDELEEDKCPTE
jgi:5-oxoprolinase (ATP-hydrolysing) subunit C